MQQTYLTTGFVRLCWYELLKLIVLNITFLLCCMPIVTIPAALTALSCSCQRILLGEKHWLSEFFRSLRRDFWQSLPLGLLFVIGPLALSYGCLFYYQASKGEGLAIALSVFCFICIYLLCCMGAYAFQMLARVNLGVAAIVRNTFCLTFQQSQTTFTWLFLAFIMILAVVLTFPYSLPWGLLLGGSLPCFAATRGILPVIDTIIVKE